MYSAVTKTDTSFSLKHSNAISDSIFGPKQVFFNVIIHYYVFILNNGYSKRVFLTLLISLLSIFRSLKSAISRPTTILIIILFAFFWLLHNIKPVNARHNLDYEFRSFRSKTTNVLFKQNEYMISSRSVTKTRSHLPATSANGASSGVRNCDGIHW